MNTQGAAVAVAWNVSNGMYTFSRTPELKNLMSADRLTAPGAINSTASPFLLCATTVLYGGANSWFNCAKSSYISTITASQPPKTTTSGPLVGAIAPGPACYITR